MKVRAAAFLALIFLVLPLLVYRADSAEGYSFLYAFGERGKAEGQFQYPVGMAVDKDNNIYVADWNNDNIQKFSSSGTFLKRFGQDDKENWIRKPVGIALHGDVIYVSEFGNHSIWIFTRDGGYKGRFGQIGRGPGQLLYPRGITVDSNGNIYVADYRNGRVQKYGPDGTYLQQVVYKDSSTGKTSNPRGILIDHEDNLYITFTGEDMVAKYDSGLNLLFLFGKKGTGPGQFVGPRYIAEDSDGNLCISDYLNNRIVQFSAGGNAGLSFGATEGPGELKRPEGLVFDSLDNLYVADAENNRVVVFAPPPRLRHRNQARLLRTNGNVDSALKEYMSLRDIDPLNKEANTFIVEHFSRQAEKAFDGKKWDESEHYYKKLLEFAPEKKDEIEEQLGRIKVLRYLWMYVGAGVGILLFVILLFAVKRGSPRKRRALDE